MSPASHAAADDTSITPVQDGAGSGDKPRPKSGPELSRISEDDRHKSSDPHTQVSLSFRTLVDGDKFANDISKLLNTFFLLLI